MKTCTNSHHVIGMHPGATMFPHVLISHSTGITDQINNGCNTVIYSVLKQSIHI